MILDWRNLCSLSLFFVANLWAEPFEQATVTKASGNVIKGKASIETGSNSRVELNFPDSTIARIGSNSKFRYIPGSREAVLDGGTLLFSLPRDAGGVMIHAGPVVATSTDGDFQLSNVGGSAKVISLNGKVVASLTSDFGEKTKLSFGQMINIASGSSKMSKPVTINLKTLISTSALMKMGPLPSQAAIEKNSSKQQAKPTFRIGSLSPDAGESPSLGIGSQGLATIQIIEQETVIAQQAAQTALAAQQAQDAIQAQQAAQRASQAQEMTRQQQAEAQRQATIAAAERAAIATATAQRQRQAAVQANVRAVQGNQGNQGNAFGRGGNQGNQGQGNQGNGNNGQGNNGNNGNNGQGNNGQGQGGGRQ